MNVNNIYIAPSNCQEGEHQEWDDCFMVAPTDDR